MIQNASYKEFSAWMDQVRADALAGDQRAIGLYLNTLQRINPSFQTIVGNGALCSLEDLLHVSIKPFQYDRYLADQTPSAPLHPAYLQPVQHQPYA